MRMIDLAAQQEAIKDRLDARISEVLAHGNYIMGEEVLDLERRLAAFGGTKHCISCANGTDALMLALMALGVGAGDAVILPSFTFAATAEAPSLLGAVPVFAEINPETYNIDINSVLRCLRLAEKRGLNLKAIIGVDLFGLPADWPALTDLAQDRGLFTIADSAQGWGGKIRGQMASSFADISTTSFFPAKPLGCYGDGGAIFTQDGTLASVLDSLRIHGKGSEKYENLRIGMNSRLDTLQAAILIEKLIIYPSELEARQKIAARYTSAMAESFVTPTVPDGYRSIWAQYTLQANSDRDRAETLDLMKRAGIPSAIYYPRPLHTQPAYAKFPRDPEGLAFSERLSQRVFSIPMHPYLTDADQNHVIEALTSKTKGLNCT